MENKDKIEVQIRLYELQLEELRSMPIDKRPITYNDQLVSISKHIKKLKSELERI